jgi:serine/threonine protein kinase
MDPKPTPRAVGPNANDPGTQPPGGAADTQPGEPSGGIVPQQFGRYRLQKKLGQGGMGTVYLAQDTTLDRAVALKIPQLAAGNSTARERFLREARSAATLHHPNICPVYDVGECEGFSFLTMAFIEGKPLSDYIVPDEPLPVHQACLIVRKLALALQEAHSKGIIHRDLKPANVMIDQRKEPVVMDFGLAGRVNPGDARLTQSGAIMGTPSYMSPEQVTGDTKAMGPATDIYSLGVILYELLSGHRPFEGPTAMVLGLIMVAEPEPLVKLRPEVGADLSAACRKAMARKVEDRYASMAELAAALTPFCKPRAASRAAGSQVATAQAPNLTDDADPAATRESTKPPAVSRTRAETAKAAAPAGKRPLPVVWIAAGAAGLLVGVLGICLVGVILSQLPGKSDNVAQNSATENTPKTKDPKGSGGDSKRKDPKGSGGEPKDTTPLFNGKDLTGWTHAPGAPATWSVNKSGHLTGRGQHTYLYSEREFADFHARVEARINDGGNSGFYFRVPSIADQDPAGYEAQIAIGNGDPRFKTGSLYNFAQVPDDLVKPGEWFLLEVIARGQRIIIKLNGQVTVNYLDDKATYKRGRLALQQLTPQTAVEFKRVEIVELPPPDAPQVPAAKSLFNGKDFNGWKIDGKVDAWAVNPGRGVLIAKGSKPGCLLHTDKEYGDFRLRLEFAVSDDANSGVKLRCKPGTGWEQLEVQIRDDSKPYSGAHMGGIYWGTDYAKHIGTFMPAPLRPVGEFNTLEIEMRGSQLRVLVNDAILVVEDLAPYTSRPKAFENLKRTRGTIALDSDRGEVQFRNIEIVELPSE